MKTIKILEIFNFWDMLNFGQLRCLLELGGFPYLSEFEQTSEMRNSQGTRGTRETPGFLQAAPLRCFFFLPPFYIAGPLVAGAWRTSRRRPEKQERQKLHVDCGYINPTHTIAP